jgi:hypothetical protein
MFDFESEHLVYSLSFIEERKIVEALTTAAGFGYPFDRDSLKEFVKTS